MTELQWTTKNPTTGQDLITYQAATDSEVESALSLLGGQRRGFQRLSFADKSEALQRLAQLLRERKESFARTMAEEMGKPLTQGLAEIEKCAVTCEYYSENLESLLMSQNINAHYDETWLVKKPMGIILAIMPWNFPFWQVIRCAVPAWISGNLILLKHAPSVQASALKIQEVVKEAFRSTGFQPLIQLPLTNDTTARLIGDPRIQGVSFTGSTATGRHIASLAGQSLKKCVLELGGSDPYIVLADADLDRAASLCVKSRFLNSGQSCIAAKRFLIHESVFQPFQERIIKEIAKLKVGDPLRLETQMGPLAEARIRDQAQHQLTRSLEQGARLVFENRAWDRPFADQGFFMPPTLVDRVTESMPLMQEECFAPVMPLMMVSSLEEALSIANRSPFGLGGAIFTRNVRKVWPLVVDELEVGTLVFNDFVQSDPRVAFGGIKDSGWGRELGPQGVLEFANLKTVGLGRG